MLFTRAPTEEGGSSLPPHLAQLDGTLSSLLADKLPSGIHHLAFEQELGRQAILNLYVPGTGITPHIDLPGRYADGIVGVSLTGGCVMSFERAPAEAEEERTEGGGEEGRGDRHDIYLPPRSVYVMSGPARWEWAHGIAYRAEDVVLDGTEERVIPRGVRVSVTLRWMKPGAGVLA